MRLSEIVVDRRQATLEALVSAIAGQAIKMHDTLDAMSNNFTLPARQTLPQDSIYELTEELIQYESQLKAIKHQVPQTMMAIAEVLNYLEP